MNTRSRLRRGSCPMRQSVDARPCLLHHGWHPQMPAPLAQSPCSPPWFEEMGRPRSRGDPLDFERVRLSTFQRVSPRLASKSARRTIVPRDHKGKSSVSTDSGSAFRSHSAGLDMAVETAIRRDLFRLSMPGFSSRIAWFARRRTALSSHGTSLANTKPRGIKDENMQCPIWTMSGIQVLKTSVS